MKGPQTNDRDSPLPRRTGHADFPHPALAKVVSARKHSQTDQSQVRQVSIEADPFANAPATLTAPTKVSRQPIAYEVIDLTKGLPGMAQLEIVGPPFEMAIQSLNQFR